MNNSQPPSSDNPLTQLCLAHAAREEHALRAALDALDALHDALRRGTPDEQEGALRRQNEAAQSLEAMRVERASLRARLADVLRVPPGAVTLSLVAGPSDGPLRQARDRLLALAAEVERRAARAAALSRAGAESLGRLLQALTGTAPAPDRYGRAGVVNTALSDSIIQARG